MPLREKLSFALDLEATMAKRSKASTGGLPRAPLQHFQGKTEVDEEVARMFEESRSLVQQMD